MTATERRSVAGPPARVGAFVPALEGMRAAAALLIIALHVGVFSGTIKTSWTGAKGAGRAGSVLSQLTVAVPIFFVLSGLLLYRAYADATLRDERQPALIPYLWRRALRIRPAYWAM